MKNLQLLYKKALRTLIFLKKGISEFIILNWINFQISLIETEKDIYQTYQKQNSKKKEFY